MSQPDYTGTDLLEVLAEIKNYNTYLANLVANRVPPSDRIVDFGAGIGTFAKILRERGYTVECVELDDKLSAQLSAAGFKTCQTLASYSDGSIPVIYTYNVLEHIEDDETVIRELWRKLKPGGQLIVYVPANEFLWTSLDDKVRHFRRYTRGEMRHKLIAAGFKNPTVSYADILGVPAALAYRLIDPGDGRIDPDKARFYDRWLFPTSRRLDYIFKYVTGKNVVAIVTK
jgi:2-polyprenyl-3-methyl-5-hydroxy-6-metoxy-1,4-benzoquinol methylase